MLVKSDMMKFVKLIQALTLKVDADVPIFNADFEEGVQLGKEIAADELKALIKGMVK